MSVKTIDITHQSPPLADLLALVADGDEVVIAEEGKVVARLVPAESSPPRVAGLHQSMG